MSARFTLRIQILLIVNAKQENCKLTKQVMLAALQAKSYTTIPQISI